MHDIPIGAAKGIAETYGYHQVVIIARKVGVDGGEHVTTCGIDAVNCAVAARMGDHFKRDLMRWSPPEPHDDAEQSIKRAHQSGVSMRDLHRVITRIYDAGTPKKAKPNV